MAESPRWETPKPDAGNAVEGRKGTHAAVPFLLRWSGFLI